MFLLPFLFACASGDDTAKSDPVDTVDTDTTEDTDVTTDNLAPSSPVVTITPERPGDGDDLTVTVLTESVDPEGAAVTLSYAWSVNGAARADLAGPVLPNAETALGDVWEVAVTPNDGTIDGAPGTASVTVGNQPPSAPVIHIDPAAPVPRDDLNLVFDAESVDPDGDPLTTTIRWYENDIYYATRDGMLTVDGLYVDGGDVFVVEVSVTDGNSEPVVATATVALPNQPPTIERVSITPTSPFDDDDLVVSAVGDDPDGGSVLFRYVWFRDGVEAVDVGDTDTVPAAATTTGEHWTVIAYGSDGHDEVSMEAAQEAIVIPWEGTTQLQIFTLSATSDGAGGYDSVSGAWAVDYLAYGGTGGNHSCALNWVIDATENSRYCRDCEFSFESNFAYDAASQVDFGCENAQEDGSGYFFFNQIYDQFNAYNTGPAFDSRSGEVQMRIVPDTNSYSWDGTTLAVQYSSTLVTYDELGNAELYMYYYTSDRVY